jgi:hypothetical protein
MLLFVLDSNNWFDRLVVLRDEEIWEVIWEGAHETTASFFD